MRKSFSHASVSLLPTPLSPHSRQPPPYCSSTTLQRLAKVMLAALMLVGAVLLYLIAHTARSTTTATGTVNTAEATSLLSELPSLPVSPHSTSRWADLTPPLSRESLGQATWAFLHTMAAVYPEQPSEVEQQSARQLLEALGWLYPCAVCAQHFRVTLAAQPPRVGSRRELSEWLCEAHNSVNARLDKPQSDTHTLMHSSSTKHRRQPHMIIHRLGSQSPACFPLAHVQALLLLCELCVCVA